jgi:DNA-binding MarR family transcriptional regulator
MTKADSDPRSRAWALFLSAHAVLLERIEAQLRRAGLPPLTWYDVLWELEKATDGKLRMHELASRIVLSRSNLTRLADRLEDARLISREECADDRRGAYCVITSAGRAMRRRMWPAYSAQIEALFAAHVSREAALQISESLAAVVQAASRTSA